MSVGPSFKSATAREHLRVRIVDILAKLTTGETLSTKDLCERLAPVREWTGQRATERLVMVNTVLSLGRRELAGRYCTRGPQSTRKLYGRFTHPLIWHSERKTGPKLCPLCQQPLPEIHSDAGAGSHHNKPDVS